MKNLFIYMLFSIIMIACIPEEPVIKIIPINQVDYIWPLCGRISEFPNTLWYHGQNCPEDRQSKFYNDYPISSTFGPRQLASESFRYDYHRGIDIPTPINSPIFAIADGKVLKAGIDPSYNDSVIMIRHYNPLLDDCEAVSCLTSVYLHVNSAVVNIDDDVKQGHLIGYSGETSFPHLHFEIRQVIDNFDKYNVWQRDSVHPLRFLPALTKSSGGLHVKLSDMDLSQPLYPKISVLITIPTISNLNLSRVDIQLFSKQNDGSLFPIPQRQTINIGHTPEQDHYVVNPLFFDMELFNRHYSYKDSVNIPWTSFSYGGQYQSPFHDSLTTDYNPNIHLDKASPDNISIGEFNGLLIAPKRFNSDSKNYQISITFTELSGTQLTEDLCVIVKAKDTMENTIQDATKNCYE